MVRAKGPSPVALSCAMGSGSLQAHARTALNAAVATGYGWDAEIVADHALRKLLTLNSMA